jgi:hypothetical protein
VSPDVLHTDGIEEDIDPSVLPCHVADVFLDSLLIESIYSSRLGNASFSRNLLGYRLDRLECASGEKDFRTVAGEGAGDRSADRPSRSVDDRVLVLLRA